MFFKMKITSENHSGLANIKKCIDSLEKIPAHQIRERINTANALIEVLPDYKNVKDTEKDNFFPLLVKLSCYSSETFSVMKKLATDYFTTLFDAEQKTIKKISFAKKDGCQLGYKIIIDYLDSKINTIKRIIYFIKTHQYGHREEPFLLCPVDAKELFIYRVLQYIGFGPKTHFILDSQYSDDVYIVTQDVAHTKDQNKKKIFKRYKDLEMKHSEHETEKGLTCIEILSRIFRLHDLVSNTTNFGRININQQRNKWKIIDFRVRTEGGSYGYLDIFRGFQSTNGMLNYSGYLGYVLRDQPEKARMKLAREVIMQLESGRLCQGGEKKLPLLKAIEQAFNEVVIYIRKNATHLGIKDLPKILGKFETIAEADLVTQLNVLQPLQMGDLGKYVVGVRENFISLAAGIKARYVELEHSNIKLAADCPLESKQTAKIESDAADEQEIMDRLGIRFKP